MKIIYNIVELNYFYCILLLEIIIPNIPTINTLKIQLKAVLMQTPFSGKISGQYSHGIGP